MLKFFQNHLIKNFKNIKSKYDKEHVTTFFRRSKNIKKINLINKTDLSYVRLTIDDAEDLKNIRGILKNLIETNTLILITLLNT